VTELNAYTKDPNHRQSHKQWGRKMRKSHFHKSITCAWQTIDLVMEASIFTVLSGRLLDKYVCVCVCVCVFVGGVGFATFSAK